MTDLANKRVKDMTDAEWEAVCADLLSCKALQEVSNWYVTGPAEWNTPDATRKTDAELEAEFVARAKRNIGLLVPKLTGMLGTKISLPDLK